MSHLAHFFLYISSFSSVILIIPEKISRTVYIIQKRHMNRIMLKSSKQLYINLITGKERTAQESGTKYTSGKTPVKVAVFWFHVFP